MLSLSNLSAVGITQQMNSIPGKNKYTSICESGPLLYNSKTRNHCNQNMQASSWGSVVLSRIKKWKELNFLNFGYIATLKQS